MPVKTRTVKRAAKIIIEKWYPTLTTDFDTNKKVVEKVAEIPSKRLRNKIAGYVTHLMRRIQKGPVRGISFKLQEEERERRDNYVPDTSAIAVDADTTIEVDAPTLEMLTHLGYEFPNVITNEL
ncbi:hypothetical protein P9112_011677 [Eukaryota sp. TZLM1-RC]